MSPLLLTNLNKGLDSATYAFFTCPDNIRIPVMETERPRSMGLCLINPSKEIVAFVRAMSFANVIDYNGFFLSEYATCFFLYKSVHTEQLILL